MINSISYRKNILQLPPELSAEQLAAALVQADHCQLKDINIQQETKSTKAYSREIIDLHFYPDLGQYTILTRPAIRCAPSTEKISPLQALPAILSKGLQDLACQRALREREAVLTTPTATAAFWPKDKRLSESQKHFLLSYLPHADLIAGDLQLTQACFATALAQPVKIHLCEPPMTQVPPQTLSRLNNWRLDVNARLAGEHRKEGQGLRVCIGPIALEEMSDFVAGHSKRYFLEQQLYAHFLPPHWHAITEILVKPAAETEYGIRLGMNSLVVDEEEAIEEIAIPLF